MKPILYESRETDFNHNGLGKMNETLSAIVTEVANGEFELEVVYPIGGRLYKDIQDHMLIKAKPNSVDDPHVFRIYEHTIDTVGQTVTIYAHTKSNDLGQNLVKDVVISNRTPQEAMNSMKMNLVEPTDYSFVSDITTRSSTEWKNRNPLNCIAGEEGSLIHYWGGEIKRDNRTIYLYRRRGRDNVAIIRDGKNINGLSLEYSTKGMVTKIIPYRTYTPEDSENEVIEYGTPVESQHIGNYPLVYVRAIDYSNDDDVTSLQTMNTKASRYFTENNGVDKPSVNVSVNLVELSDSSEYEKFKDFENVELFDTVTVYSKQYDIQIEAKITTLVYDSLTGKNISLEMGSYRTGLIESTERTYTELIGEKEAKLIQTIQVAANGKNRIFRGVDEPTTGMVKNDLWYKPVGDGETEMYQFDGAYWQIILNTKDINANKELVDDAITKAEQAKQAAEQAYSDSVAEAERLVDEQTVAFDAEMDVRKGEILEAKEQADLAVSTANSNAEAIFGKLDLATYEANKTAVETELGKKLATATYNAQKQTQDALIAGKVALTTYNAKMTSLDTAISGTSLRVDDLEDGFALTATKTEVDSLKTRMNTAELNITATSNQLALKASQSDLNATTGRLTTAEGRITANSDAIELRATKTDVNALTGRVSTAEGTITAQAGQIALRATTATVNALASRVSATEASLVVQSDKIDLAATKSELTTAIDGIEVGGRNLLRGSKDLVVGGLSFDVGSRKEYHTVNIGQTLMDLDEGTEITISFDIQMAKGNYLTIYNSNTKGPKTFDARSISNIGTKKQRVSITTFVRDRTDATLGYNSIEFYSTYGTSDWYEISNIKIEKGNKATDWTPAPEDVETAYKAVSKAERELAEVNAKAYADGVVNAEEQRAIIDAQAKLDEAKRYVDDVEIGGRNYFTKSHTFAIMKNIAVIVPRGLDWSNGFHAVGQTNNDGKVRIGNVITGNGWWTVSFDYWGTQNLPISMGVSMNDYGSVTVHTNGNRDNKKTRVYASFNITNYSDIYNFVDFTNIRYVYNYVDNIKIEKGNKATDWTPAPEDVEDAISTVQSNLTVEAGKITALTTRVSGAESNITSVTQTVSGINTTISTLRTDVNGKATIVALNQVKSTADGNKTTITNHAGRLTTVESNVSGLQTTVSNKADKSQITQLENSITSIVSKGTNSITNGDFSDGLNGWRVNSGSAQVRTLINGEVALSLGPSATGVYLHGEDYGHVEDFYTFTIRAKGDLGGTALLDIGFLNLNNYYKTTFTLTSNWETYSFTTKFVVTGNANFHIYSRVGNVGNLYVDWVTLQRGSYASDSQITQLSDQINLRVTKGGLMSEINVQAGRTIISTGKLYLDTGSTIMTTAYVNDLKAKSIEAVTANITSIRSQILVTDSVTSTHIKAENAMIDTLFGTTALITRLTSKTAFISNIQAINISADRITTGTLNASNVNITNMNASNIKSGTLSAIKVTNTFNRGSGVTGTITIDSDINMQATDGSRFLLSEKRISFSDGDYETVVRNDGIDFYRAGVKHMGQRFFTFEDGTSGIRFESRHVGERALSIRGNQLLSHDGAGGREGEHHLYLSPGGTGYVVAGDATGARAVMRARTFELNRGVGLTTYDTGEAKMRLYSEGFIWHWGTSATTTNQMLRMDSDAFRMYKKLDMTGQQVVNTSDRRIKTGIEPTLLKGRETIRKYNFVDYYYTREGYPKDRQFGLIAQDAPIIGSMGEDGYWTISTTKQTMLNSLAIKEIDDEVVRNSTYITQHDLEIDILKTKIQELENTITLLEEKM